MRKWKAELPKGRLVADGRPDEPPHLLKDRAQDWWVLTQLSRVTPGPAYNLLPLASNGLSYPLSEDTVRKQYGPLARRWLIHPESAEMDGVYTNCPQCNAEGHDNINCAWCQTFWAAHKMTGCAECQKPRDPNVPVEWPES